VEALDRAGLERSAPELDRAVDADPEVDRFCTRTDWVLPFHDAFHPACPVVAARRDRHFVVLAAEGRVLRPLEAMWGFASPLVGAGSVALLAELAAVRAPRREVLYLAGLDPEGARVRELVARLGASHSLSIAALTVRFVAELGDFEAFLARRSKKLRASLRAAARRARAEGVAFEAQSPAPGEADAVYARVLGVERRSWKAASGNGVDRGPMRDFYARMFPRLAARGALRVLFASRAGEDVGYLAGGLAGRRFRGLQFSFDERWRRLGLGNALQLEMVARLCAEGAAEYDLGGQSAYKARWGEREQATCSLVARPRE
jgi:CelD/BcsL family acetyltransferase involved in cellulose biosynthesis